MFRDVIRTINFMTNKITQFSTNCPSYRYNYSSQVWTVYVCYVLFNIILYDNNFTSFDLSKKHSNILSV